MAAMVGKVLGEKPVRVSFHSARLSHRFHSVECFRSRKKMAFPPRMRGENAIIRPIESVKKNLPPSRVVVEC